MSSPAARLGRAITLAFVDLSPAVPILDVTEKNLEISREAVDISNGDDDGVRRLLATAGQKQVSLTISGVGINDQLASEVFVEGTNRTLRITWPSGQKIQGDFFLAKYGEGMPHKDKPTWTAEYQSAGAITFTAHS